MQRRRGRGLAVEIVDIIFVLFVEPAECVSIYRESAFLRKLLGLCAESIGDELFCFLMILACLDDTEVALRNKYLAVPACAELVISVVFGSQAVKGLKNIKVIVEGVDCTDGNCVILSNCPLIYL